MSSYKKCNKNKNILNYEVKHKLGYSGIHYKQNPTKSS